MIKQIPSEKIKDYIKDNPKSVLLDVRTKEEWDQIGKPDGDKIGLKTYFLSIQFEGKIKKISVEKDTGQCEISAAENFLKEI